MVTGSREPALQPVPEISAQIQKRDRALVSRRNTAINASTSAQVL